MLRSLLVGALAVASVVAETEQPNKYRSTDPSDVRKNQATAPTSHETSNITGKAFDRFIVIWLENTDYDKAAGDPNLVGLAKSGILLSNYFGVTHPSEPNYIASISGDNYGCDNDNFNQLDGNVSSIVDLLEDKKISWGTYQEDMPYSGFEGMTWVNPKTKANDYVRRHNPPISHNANTIPSRLAKQKNLTMFYEDLKAKTLPQWIFITPNMTNDGHDSSVAVAGTWSRTFLDPLLKDSYFTDRTLILLTFDETHTYTEPNRIFGILLGGAVPDSLKGTEDTRFYNHYSEISTVEANWDLHTLGRWDVGANVFNLVAQKTGDGYRPNDAATSSNPTIFYNNSFAGPLNAGYETAQYPAPNVDLVSPQTGRTVLPAIVSKWGKRDSYYTDSVVVPDGKHAPPGYDSHDH